MNKVTTFILSFLLLQSLSIFAQQRPIEVADLTQKIDSRSIVELYYGFDEGDQILLTIEEQNGKKIKNIEILQMPSSSIYNAYKTNLVKKTINVSKRCIYKFKFENTAFTKRICKINIERIPKDIKHVNFNSAVRWKTIYDTLRSADEQKHIIRKDTVSNDIYSSNIIVKAGERVAIDFNLPKNTIAWSYYIGVGESGANAFTNGLRNVQPIVTSMISKFSPMAALALTGVNVFDQIKNINEDQVKYFFLQNQQERNNFINSKTKFKTYKKGDVINEAGQMKSPLKGKIFLGLFNNNLIEEIKVTIKATAVTVTNEWSEGSYKQKNITSRQEPYLEP